jgi:tetratricopeptide (TPR) repeat protein
MVHTLTRLWQIGLLVGLLATSASLSAADTSSSGAKAGNATAKPAHPVRKQLDLALRQRKAKRYDEAIATLRQAEGLEKDDDLAAELRFALAQSYFSKGQAALEHRLEGVDGASVMAQSIAVLDDVMTKHPKHERASSAAYLSGSAYLLLGDLAKGVVAYRKAHGDYPESKLRAKALLRVGVCQSGLDRPKEAVATYRRVVREFPDSTANVKKARKYLNEQVLVGKPAPRIPTKDWLYGVVDDGVPQTFSGQVYVVVFFATWCTHCSHNVPRLKGVIERWSGQGVAFIGVANPTDPKNTEPVDAYIAGNEIAFDDVGLDQGYRSWPGYRVTGLPATVVVDRQGVVRWRGNLAYLPESLIATLNAE